MALYGNDIDDEHNVLEADLGWIVKWKKGDFVGRDALEQQKEQGIERKLVGFEMVDRGIARHGYPVFVDSDAVGSVTSGSHAPYLKKSIGLTYLSHRSPARTGRSSRSRFADGGPPRVSCPRRFTSEKNSAGRHRIHEKRGKRSPGPWRHRCFLKTASTRKNMNGS